MIVKYTRPNFIVDMFTWRLFEIVLRIFVWCRKLCGYSVECCGRFCPDVPYKLAFLPLLRASMNEITVSFLIASIFDKSGIIFKIIFNYKFLLVRGQILRKMSCFISQTTYPIESIGMGLCPIQIVRHITITFLVQSVCAKKICT